MATGASQIFVERTREALAILGIGAGGGLFALIGMAESQQSNIDAGDHIELDTIEEETAGGSGITVTGGANDQTDGLISLPQGHIFRVEGFLNCQFSSAVNTMTHQIRNNTAAALVGAQARTDVNANEAGSHHPIAYIDTSAGIVEIEWRIVTETALISITSNLIGNGQTYLTVDEV